MNSLITTLIALTFVCMGYYFLVKRFNRSYRDDDRVVKPTNKRSTLFNSIQSNSLLLTSLTAVISLYWGWSPAILWVVIGAIFIHFNMETVLHERLIDEVEDDEQDEVISHYFSEHSNKKKLIGVIILNSFSALASIILIVIASEIMSDYTGAAIAVIAITLAILIWQNNNATKIGRLSSIGTGAIGIVLSDKIGLYFIGSWQPIAKFPGLVIDEKWLFAIILVLLFKQIRNNNSDKLEEFLTLFSKFTSFFTTAIIASVFYFLATARPLIDAPIHTQSGNTPYYFLIISLVAIVGATNLLSYLKHLSAPLPINPNTSTSPRKQHGKVLFEVFGLVVLIFLLASSNGIGAWNSHFVNWDASRELMLHLDLAIDSISSIYGDFSKWGVDETSVKNIIATIFLFNGLCLLNDNTISKEFLGNKLEKHNESSPLQNGIGHFIFYGFLIITLTIGATINSWLLLGSLSLVGVAWILLCDSHLTLDCEISNPTILIVTAAVVPLAGIQLIAQCWLWWSAQHWFYTVSGALLSIAYLLLVSSHAPSLMRKYRASRDKTPISLE